MDELLKQRVMMAMVAFNLTIIIYQIGFNSSVLGGSFTILKLMIGVAIAGVAAGAAYVLTQMTQS